MDDCCFDILHGNGNPRNSEGSFLLTKDGKIRFIYSRYGGTSCSDNASADLAEMTSEDGGETWKDRGVVVSREDADNLMSVSLLRLQDGSARLFYLEKRKTPCGMACVPVMHCTDDDGESWGPARRLISNDGYYVLVNDHAVQLSSGRIILPLSMHLNRTNGSSRPGMVITLFSDDNGKTWFESETMLIPDFQAESSIGFQEPGVIELEPGKVRIWFRTALGFQFRALSYDGGSTWGPAVPDLNFPSPVSPMSIRRDPSSGFLYAVWNDAERRHQLLPTVTDRNPLVLMRSRDNGVTWDKSGSILLESERGHGYCYTAMMFNGGDLLLAYCCGPEENGVHQVQDLRIRKITLSGLWKE